MRLAVGIPTFQEADSIANVTRQIDAGLALLADDIDCVIVNADGSSPDETASLFLATPTQFPKLSLITTDHLGKGSNIFSLFRLCIEQEIDALVLIDGDLSSVTPHWPGLLAGPLLRVEADYVTPLYRRRRFDAGTTNQFAYPLLDAYLGRNIRQPIGGEFGLSKAFVEFLLQQTVDRNVLGYGIDIFMTAHAVGAGFRIVQANLGFKLHKPSFSKSHRIFPDVATTALGLIRKYPMSSTAANAGSGDPATAPGPDDFHRASEIAFDEAAARARELMPVYSEWLGFEAIQMAAELDSSRPCISAPVWADLLAACIAKAARNTDDTGDRRLAETLFPAWGIRSVSFARDNLHHAPEKIELEITSQNRLFRRALEARMIHGGKPTSA